MFRNFAKWLNTQAVHSPGSSGPKRDSRIPSVLKSGDLSVVFQPIVDLQSGETFAYETMVRSNSPVFQGPPALFAEAINAKVCGALGRVIREMAIEACPDYPLFLNIHPNEFDEGWLVQPNDPIFRHEHQVYLEITESVPLSHFQLCNSVLREIRSKGVYLAVDDLGAGYSNLKYIADLSPEIVKLDRALVANIHENRRLRQLVRALVALCIDLDAKIVAEGVEKPEEVFVVRSENIHFGQGYVLARPDNPPPLYGPTDFAKLLEHRPAKDRGDGVKSKDASSKPPKTRKKSS